MTEFIPGPKPPTPNVELLRRTLKEVERAAEVGEWRQGTWWQLNADTACGTAGCFAGHACSISGEKFGFGPLADGGYVDRLADGAPIPYRAQELLGLTRSQADDLFRWTNTLEDLRDLVDLYCEGAE